MNPKYTLYYFAIKALGEPIRLLLTYGEADFKDVRIEMDDWDNHKQNMPLGQMPVLEVDGKRVHQSGAICRYLAKQFGLAGSNDWEAMEIDIAVDTISDLRLKTGPVYWDTDEAWKEMKYAEMADSVVFLLEKLDEMAAKNSGHMAAGKLTWADLFFTGVADYLKTITRTDILGKYPNLKKVVDNVMAIPQIKTWYGKAPKTEL